MNFVLMRSIENVTQEQKHNQDKKAKYEILGKENEFNHQIQPPPGGSGYFKSSNIPYEFDK